MVNCPIFIANSFDIKQVDSVSLWAVLINDLPRD